ncbi:hypothetical protein AMK09_25265 [Streptomyces sp. CB02488]|uniref:hypothetical protein n=1 Tax=Streptomyces sp. CB02488 TaxID=1703920 RepID=UPI000939E13B|nr:hypothetical protein [Streptomyces sp. CB02488]OKK15455.1 hypothetical protein AMK09_25265 [Streptomyces sp. CB02488]
MNDEFIEGLRQFQQQALNLQSMMTDMQQRMPLGVEGTDAQGAVTVRLATDGLPEFIRAASDWQRRQEPEAIGAAVSEAYGAAMSQQMTAWAQAFEDSDWQGKADRLDSQSAQPEASADPAAQPDIPERDLRYVVSRPLDVLAEDVLSAFDAVDRMDETASEPAEVEGTSAGRHVTLAVTKGALRSCEVDRQWAAGQSYIALNQAFEEALGDARGKLNSAEAAGADAIAGLQVDSLLDEALAILRNPQRFID